MPSFFSVHPTNVSKGNAYIYHIVIRGSLQRERELVPFPCLREFYWVFRPFL